jgi:hypothetical protein
MPEREASKRKARFINPGMCPKLKAAVRSNAGGVFISRRVCGSASALSLPSLAVSSLDLGRLLPRRAARSFQWISGDAMTKPLVIMVGADKGGVGKTTISRALDDYLRAGKAVRKVYDGEWPNGDLKQFAEESEIVDMQSINDQMRVFDRLRGVTLVDIKAGLFTDVLDSLNRTGLLDDVRAGRFNLALLHVLGPSAASLSEIANITTKLGSGAVHLLVKNYVNEAGFEEWEADPRFADALASTGNIVIPHLEARAATEVQQCGLAFSAFVDQSQSRVLVGYVRAWLRDASAAFTGAGINRLVDEAR